MKASQPGSPAAFEVLATDSPTLWNVPAVRRERSRAPPAISQAQSLICYVNLVLRCAKSKSAGFSIHQDTNQAFLMVSRMVSMSSFTGWNSAYQKTSLEG